MSSWVAPQFSCHAVRVKLDRDTGVARVLHVSAAHDSGTIINPVGATGQVEGAVLMGIGQALTEGTTYDAEGRQRLLPRIAMGGGDLGQNLIGQHVEKRGFGHRRGDRVDRNLVAGVAPRQILGQRIHRRL